MPLLLLKRHIATMGSIQLVSVFASARSGLSATSWIAVGGTLGFLIGSAVGTLMTVIFTADELSDWA